MKRSPKVPPRRPKAPAGRGHDDDTDDALDVRGPDAQIPNLVNPRPPAWVDLICAERRRLVAKAAGIPTGKPADGAAGLPTRAYPYTRIPPLTNDELGYGELVEVTLIAGTDRQAFPPQPRVSQRTKTGRQVLVTESARRKSEIDEARRKRGA
jgi:hypothetical protein